MLNLNQLVTFEQGSEQVFEQGRIKKQYSIPRIYTGGEDLSKRWYVYFSFRNPATGKLEKSQNIYGKANNYRTKEERLAVLSIYRSTVHKYLKLGYNPYQDNLQRFLDEKNKVKKEGPEPEQNPVYPGPEPSANETPQQIELDKTLHTSIKDAIDRDWKIKSKTLRASSLRSYKSHISVFLKWLKEKHSQINNIEEIDRGIVTGFLTEMLSKSSARNRNNYRASLSSLFQLLEDHQIVGSNIVKPIKVLKSEPKRNKVYSANEVDNIFDYLKDKDPLLLLYVKFVAYNFLRPLEVCRLKVGDINLKDSTLSFKAKNSALKKKIIPRILSDELPDLSKLDREKLLFTPDGFGMDLSASLESRRGYFTKRFARSVKKKFDLDLNHTLYGFRHTYLTKIYRELLSKYSPFEAKSRLMHISGHTSMKALDKYLREHDVELPEDYSLLIEN